MLFCLEEARRYKRCESHDSQSWHSNSKRSYVLHMNPRLFLQLIKKKLTSLDKFPHWTTTKLWFRPSFFFAPHFPHLPKFHLFTRGGGGGGGGRTLCIVIRNTSEKLIKPRLCNKKDDAIFLRKTGKNAIFKKN